MSLDIHIPHRCYQNKRGKAGSHSLAPMLGCPELTDTVGIASNDPPPGKLNQVSAIHSPNVHQCIRMSCLQMQVKSAPSAYREAGFQSKDIPHPIPVALVYLMFPSST